MTPKKQLPSGLGAHSTAREAIGERRLDGVTAIVTGGYAGIGPGAILDTGLARHYDPEELKVVVERARRIGSFKTVAQGAARSGARRARSSTGSAASTAKTATSRRSRARATTASGPMR